MLSGRSAGESASGVRRPNASCRNTTPRRAARTTNAGVIPSATQLAASVWARCTPARSTWAASEESGVSVVPRAVLLDVMNTSRQMHLRIMCRDGVGVNARWGPTLTIMVLVSSTIPYRIENSSRSLRHNWHKTVGEFPDFRGTKVRPTRWFHQRVVSSGCCSARQRKASEVVPCACLWARWASLMRISIRSASLGLLSHSSRRRIASAEASRVPETHSMTQNVAHPF
jgi:hypothetical protein